MWDGDSCCFQGYSIHTTTLPVRVLRLLGLQTGDEDHSNHQSWCLLGAEYLIVTNAAGGINPDFAVQDVMIMQDHINFVGMAGQSGLIGTNGLQTR